MKMKTIRFNPQDGAIEKILREFAHEIWLQGKRKPHLFMKFYVEPLAEGGQLVVKSESKIKGKRK